MTDLLTFIEKRREEKRREEKRREERKTLWMQYVVYIESLIDVDLTAVSDRLKSNWEIFSVMIIARTLYRLC
jgi:hypothetical protein